MEEDIDIEENDLVYPRIESIYSDANIKTEPIDIDEDDYDSVQVAESSSDYYMAIPNKIILGSKPSTLGQLDPLPGPSAASHSWKDQDDLFECEECKLIFPTENELDSHKMTCHSFLVARPISRAIKSERISISSTSSRSFLEDNGIQKETVRRQKAVKSTAKSALNNTFPMLHNAMMTKKSYGDVSPGTRRKDAVDKEVGILCKHCDVRFPDEIALIKHTYELLPEKDFKCEFCDMSFDTQLGLRGHRAKHFKKTGDFPTSGDSETLLQCNYCSCYLMYPGFMKKHLLTNHKVTDFAVKHVKFSGKCAICFKTLSGYKQYNTHLLKVHRKIFMSKTPKPLDVAPVKMKCTLCSQIFTSRYSAYKHKAEKHPDHSQKHTFNTVYDKPIKQLPADPPTLKPKLQTPKNKTYIPKQNLFKCNKCQIHFVSCSAAFAHSKRCSLAKGDWKCNKCRRTFTMSEKSLHTQQHQFSEKFKVHIVCDKIISKVLCRCPKCELLFDELSFGEHVSSDCAPQGGMDCKSCDLKIHSDCYAKHRRYHNKYNFSSSDFILIDFVDVSFQDAPVKETKIGQHKQVLMYCSNCSCNFYKIMSKLKYHLGRKCDTLAKRNCTICGLIFSYKLYLKHMRRDHDNLKLKLGDIKFIRIQDSKVIDPVMPEFFQCDRCKVRFITSVAKSSHNCTKQTFETCPKCSQKYDSATYDIHLAFHNYGSPKIQDKASPSLLKLFSCTVCNYGFHSYDDVVEHCQKHYTNSEELVTKPCKTCKLKYADPHKISHANFEVLKFEYDKLLTSEWFEGFDSLPKDVVEDILSKSVYNVMRNIRLELLVEGPTERTLFKCAQCELNFEQDYVIEHSMETCSSTPRFECSSCTAVFKTRLAKKSHMNVHVIYGDDITFREIIFNNESDKELNEALRTGRQKESLKFRKCQQCKLLIKKSDYQAHVSGHDNKVEIVQFKFRRTNKHIAYKLYKPVSAAKKLYTVYKCRSCNACIMQKANLVRHKCLPPERFEKCPKCSLYFLSWNIKRHVEQHTLIPKFIPKNFAILEFEILKNSDSLARKRRRYSFDDDASTGTGVTVSVSKTYDTRKVTGRPYSDNLSEDSQDNVSESVDTSVSSNAYAKKYIKRSFVVKVESDIESEKSQSVVEYSPENTKDLADSALDIEKWRVEMKNKLYQCESCYLCFSHQQLLINHLSECADSNLIEPLTCDRCDILFHPSLISFHEKLHELVRRNPIENYIYLINISTNGGNMNNDHQWLHKCKRCNIHYLSIRSLEYHFSSNHVLTEKVDCEKCGLTFTKRSRTRHMRIQHEEGSWSKGDLHIETTEKKIVCEGDFCLTSVKTRSLKTETSEEIEIIAENGGLSIDGTEETNNSRVISDLAVSKEQVNDNSSAKLVHENENKSRMKFLDDGEEIDHNLFKCGVCNKHYLTKLRLVSHFMDSTHKVKPQKCKLCDFLFDKRGLMLHNLVQHERHKFSRKDFVITTLTQNENKSIVTKEEVNSVKNDSILNANLSENKKESVSLSEKMKEVANELKYGSSGPIDNYVYKCVECSLHYTNRRTLLLHIVIRKHQQIEFAKCDICGLLFGKGSLLKHKNEQHRKLKLSRKDLIITDVFGVQLPDNELNENNDQNSVAYASSIDTDDLPLKQIEDKGEFDDTALDDTILDDTTLDDTALDDTELDDIELDNTQLADKLVEVNETLRDKFEKKKYIKNFKLYQCKDCKVCIEKTERNLHVCCSDIQRRQCIQCCLLFRNTDVVQHKRLHRKYRELSRKNFIVTRFGRRAVRNHKIYKCVSCSTHFMSLNSLEWHMNAMNHQTKRGYCKTCGLFFGQFSLNRHKYIHHKKLNLTLPQLNIVYVSDKDNLPIVESKEAKSLNSSINTTVSEPEATSNAKTIKKLFKCVECDVYFLTRASYYTHIYKHRSLDATEFIDCNICDLQFLNESLGAHMKTHKDKSFCLDKLLIEEYHPNSADSVKIEFYFAKDRLNSKLVSTTTPFDNDDETVDTNTDEQLSIIDSTSDQMPTAKVGEVIVNNSCAGNSDTVREETINPIGELPNIDVTGKTD